MFSTITRRNLLAGAVATALVGIALPVNADESSCTFALYSLGSEGCQTGGVEANKGGHFIYLSVSPFARYELIDQANNMTVAQGKTGFGWGKKTVFGLYSRYRLEVRGLVFGSVGHGYISNT